MNEKDKQFLYDIYYFWNEKGDITRYIEYDRERLTRLSPLLMRAWDNYELSKNMLDSLTKD